MREPLFMLLLALAWFGAIDLAVSAVVAAVGSLMDRGVVRLSPRREPAALLALKLAPGFAGLFFTLALFLPAQWRFEPPRADESAGYTLVALGLLGAAMLLSAARRAVRDWLATRRLEREWRRRAVGRLDGAAPDLPIYGLPDDRPVVSMTGLWRPRVFVSRAVRRELTDDELDASLAHERAHHQSRDNLKRLAVACSPDLLDVWAGGRAIERRWREAIEFAADARAAGGSERRAVLLASALLKVARMTPPGALPAAGSTFHDGAPIAERISRLLAPAAPGESGRTFGRAWSGALCGMTAVAALLAAEGAWLAVHAATEGLVRFLP